MRVSHTNYEWNQRMCVGDLIGTKCIMGTLQNFEWKNYFFSLILKSFMK